MKAATVKGAGQSPVYGDFPDPVPSSDSQLVKVTASALSGLARRRATGTHYSSSHQFPLVVGVDGVGLLQDATRVYFAMPKEPHGGVAEQTIVSPDRCLPLPDELDDVSAAAIANPGMSSWAAYTERAKLKAGETVLINGGTGAAGRLAIQIAKHLGAKKVIATGRNPAGLRRAADLGADVILPLIEDRAALESSFVQEFAAGVDVVIDYLWGKSAESLLKARAEVGRDAGPLRYVEVGAASGGKISLPGNVLRSSSIELMGSGLGSVPTPRLLHCVDELFKATVPGGFKIDMQSVPLSDFEAAWSNEDHTIRTVFTTV